MVFCSFSALPAQRVLKHPAANAANPDGRPVRSHHHTLLPRFPRRPHSHAPPCSPCSLARGGHAPLCCSFLSPQFQKSLQLRNLHSCPESRAALLYFPPHARSLAGEKSTRRCTVRVNTTRPRSARFMIFLPPPFLLLTAGRSAAKPSRPGACPQSWITHLRVPFNFRLHNVIYTA